ncbi:MAG TPA: DUF3426 domain-containing protein [Alphaproteobacteria bacterium]|jgi:predicted Zn finger-like uncharacterized protein|nr:DUF3426 domain-containing protein [Alphaproteobacteria bacterium]
MILTCPKCATRFSIDPKALGAQGRKVRCSTCHHVWHQTLPAEAETAAAPRETLSFEEPAGTAEAPAAAMASASASVAAPAMAAAAGASAAAIPAQEPPAPEMTVRRFERPPVDAEEQRTIWPVLLAWLLFFAMIVAIVAGFYRFRQQFVDLWPPAVQLYEMLDIDVVPPPGYGLRIEVGDQSRAVEEGAPVLIIKGTVANISDRPRRVAHIQGTMFDAAGRPVQSWDFAANKEILAAHETIGFETRIKSPAPSATRFELNFLAN